MKLTLTWRLVKLRVLVGSVLQEGDRNIEKRQTKTYIRIDGDINRGMKRKQIKAYFRFLSGS